MAESTVGLIFRLRADSDQARNDIKQLHRVIATETAEAGKAAKSNLSGIGDLLKIAGGNLVASAVSTVTSALIEGGKAVLDYSSKLEQTKIGFETLLGSGEKATKLLKEIQEFAKSTPFEFQGIAALSQRLLGANVEASKVIPLMRDIGNVVAATGETSQERLEGVTVALIQMISKQKVSAEEMEQLAERGVNGFQLLSQATGKSQSELRKMAEQGQISSDLMIKALQKISQEKFGDAMEKQSRTFSGAMSNIKDSIMIVASQAFEPLYKEISAFTIRFQKDIESKGSDYRAVGNTIASYIGEGLGQGIGKVFEWLGKYVGTRLKEIFTGENIIDPITKNLFGGLVRGFTNAIGLTTEEIAQKSIADLRKIDDTNSQIADTVLKMPSIADKLEADKAKKQSEALSGIISDLTSRIAFFGQESEVAAAKQRLINAGITDLTTNDAKRVLVLAEIYDRLESAQKKQQEYTQKVQSFREELQKTSDDARFQMDFPNATELDRFQNWVRKNRIEFFGLKAEVEQTEEVLRRLINLQNYRERNEDQAAFFKTIRAEIESFAKIDTNAITAKFSDLLKNLSFGRFEDASRMNETIQGFLQTFKTLGIEIKDLEKDWEKLLLFDDGKEDEEIKKLKESNLETEKLLGQRLELLQRFRTLMSNFKNEKGVQIFTDDRLNRVLEFFDELGSAVKKNELTESIKKLDEVMLDLGVTVKGFNDQTDLEKLITFLSDPQITEALKQRAAALGLTVEQLRELIIEAQAAKEATAGDIESPDKGKEGKTPGFFDSFISGVAGYLENVVLVRNANNELEFSFEKMFATMAQMGLQAFSSLAQGFGQMVSNWVLYGDAAGQGLRKMVAQVLAQVAQTATVYAIMCLAAAALATTAWGAALLGGTPGQFLAAAAVFGSVAVGAAIAGRAVAGNAFKQTNAANTNAQSQTQTSSQTRQAQTEEALRIIAEDRANPSRNEMILKLKVESDSSHIVDVIETNIGNNGNLRDTFLKLAEVV